MLWDVFNDYLLACQGADYILLHLLTALPAVSIAEKLKRPAFPFYLQNVHPTRHYPSAAAPPIDLHLDFCNWDLQPRELLSRRPSVLVFR